jgi:DNA-binding NarL/FixJ family response regulator
MSAVAASTRFAESAEHAVRNEVFLKFLPTIKTHAKVQFRHLPAVDREEAIAEATAAAFLTVHSSMRNGSTERMTQATVANYAVKHVRDGRHVGTSRDAAKDVLSRRAQQRGNFRVLGLRWDSILGYDCVKDSITPVWHDRLAGLNKPTPADQAAFRIDWSTFLRGQTRRTRTALAMLAAGHQQIEVADRLGVTPAAICQRVKKAEKEWWNLQQWPSK